MSLQYLKRYKLEFNFGVYLRKCWQNR